MGYGAKLCCDSWITNVNHESQVQECESWLINNNINVSCHILTDMKNAVNWVSNSHGWPVGVSFC